MNTSRATIAIVFIALAAMALSGCGSSSQAEKTEKTAPAASKGIPPQVMADAVHSVIEADRVVYTKNVVNRLQNEEKVIKASEHWKDDKALPLPAQMLRMGSELSAQKDPGFTYALLSMWPVNKQNGPKTDAEKSGLKAVADTKQNFYTEEMLGGKKYFTAIYPDVAVANACIACHNGHTDSPRNDFKLNDVMGGVVVRIPLD